MSSPWYAGRAVVTHSQGRRGVPISAGSHASLRRVATKRKVKESLRKLKSMGNMLHFGQDRTPVLFFDWFHRGSGSNRPGPSGVSDFPLRVPHRRRPVVDPRDEWPPVTQGLRHVRQTETVLECQDPPLSGPRRV